MLLSHAQRLNNARAAIAARADQAATVEAASAYERVLIELDRIHGNEAPGLEPAGFAIEAGNAPAAVEALMQNDLDELDLELVLALLETAEALDRK